MNRSELSLQRRITLTLITLGVVVALVVSFAAWAFVSMRQMQQQVIDNYYTALSSSNRQFVALVDTETAIRGYALTGDEDTLAPLTDAQAVLSGDQADQLRELVGNDPVTLAALDATAASAGRWWTQWAEPTLAQVRADGPQAVTQAEVEEGRQLFDQVRADYDTYVGDLRERRAAAVQRLETRTTFLFAAVVAVALVGVVAVGSLWLLLRRWVTGPLADLAHETRVVRAGALEHQVTVHGPPELVRLGADVEGMRQELVAQIGVAQAAARRLEVATAQLEERSADLERSNRELEQFAYVASHDLQEPLRKVASFTQMLQRRYAGQLDERADQYIEFAVDGAKRMQQLINDLLQFSRVGRVTAPQSDVDLDGCLDGALRDLETRIEESDAVVTRDPLPVVHGEGPLLTQVFLNLVGNALKFRSEEAPRVHVGVRQVGQEWEISVSDNGIGIEPQYAERVFVLFQRLHPKDLYAGTGIGLALARKIVEYHGGSIEIDSDHTGPGTVIRLRLPVADTETVRHDDAAGGDGAATGVRQDGVTTTSSGGAA